ncbi:MAG: hypothetical protein H8E34_06530 [Bacteroidetes bacterium]|nr:hypothetical protein [Bacteroidota bacterium]
MKSTTYGRISLALFMVCIISGIFLAIPYNVDLPYESISTFVIINPAAALIRNIHYWSAQLFLFFILIHIWDHTTRVENVRLKKGIWIRLSIGVLVIFLAMLTGFLLVGDANSIQAHRILKNLIGGLPLIGSILAYSLTGTSENLQQIYVHHIATFTIFIVIIIMEHARIIWPKLKELVPVIVLVLMISFFFTAPLHDNFNTVIKGPWYFVGLQELLHWLTIPQLSFVLVVGFLGLIFLVPYSNNNGWLPKRGLLILTIFYLFLTLTGYFFRGPEWRLIWPWEKNYSHYIHNPFKVVPVSFFDTDIPIEDAAKALLVMGRKESCVICHDEMDGFTPSHNPEALGCYSCHGGNPFTLNKETSHKGVEFFPGNLDNATSSCGSTNCHPDITQRIETVLMATLSGMISVDKFVFNEFDKPDLLTNIHHLGNSAADEHLKNLCVRCHLGNPKTETGPITEKSRGGGCLACHLNYEGKALTSWQKNQEYADDTSYLYHHSSISLKVTNDHCFGCHSRSGRISTNYEGWHETTINVDSMSDNKLYRLVEDTRVFTFVKEDVHHTLGLDCIDCHNSYELMGDGNFYSHEENQVNIDCKDCHLLSEPQTINYKNLDYESAIITSLRFDDFSNKKYLVTEKQCRPLINTYFEDDTAFMISKNTKKIFAMSKPAEICTAGTSHDKLSCSSCHSAWAPSCIGCHNEYDAKEPGYNMLTNREKQGSWVEYVGEYNAHLPALGVRINNDEKEIIPVVPGMVLTIDVGSFSKDIHDSLIFRRLFAPSAPHTTSSEGRSCKSCHNNPVALGYGKGDLKFIPINSRIKNGKGTWNYDSHYRNNPHDNLPEDAWIGFLDDRAGEVVSTRTNVVPFSINEQQKILTVGACLTCHDDNSIIMQQSLIKFDSLMENLSSECVVPVWE